MIPVVTHALAGCRVMAEGVKNVVFDIGNVLLRWDPRLLYRQLIPDPDQLDWFLSEVCTMEWNSTLDAGADFDGACDELAWRHPDHADLVHAWKRQDEMVGGEVPGTADLVARLRARGVPMFLLTNMPAKVFAARRATWPVFDSFDGAVVSGEEGVLKPSREIFAVLTHRYGLVPSETFFIDDSQANVHGARAAGLHAHHFTGTDSLAEALAARGLV